MSEAKKRARKSKLEVRDYVDLEETENKNLQSEVAHTRPSILRKIHPKPAISEKIPPKPAILEKISPPPPRATLDFDHTYALTFPTAPPSSLQLSVQVEVEEFQEPSYVDGQLVATQNRDRNQEINSVHINLEQMYKTADEIKRSSTNYADIYLGTELKNVWGRVLILQENDDPYNELIQTALHEWGFSLAHSKSNKESPIFYQCHLCSKAWWYLEPFRQHIRIHDYKILKVYHQENGFDSYIVASRSHFYLPTYVPCEGDCYRCGNPFAFHIKPYKHMYSCRKCNQTLPNCTTTALHHLNCVKSKPEHRDKKMHKCTICPAEYFSLEKFETHVLNGHDVRSDIPVPFISKKCNTCKRKYHQYSVHICTKPLSQSCQFCYRKFPSKFLQDVHTQKKERNYKCRVCNMTLDIECMETQHMLSHTDKFRMVYRCINGDCPTTLLFKDEVSVKLHTSSFHKKKYDRRRTYYEKVVVPVQCLDLSSTQLMDAESSQDKEIKKETIQESQDSEMVDWCVPSSETENQMTRDDSVLIKQEILELPEEPDNQDSQEDSDEGAMDYASMLSKVFKVSSCVSKKVKRPRMIRQKKQNTQVTTLLKPEVIKLLNSQPSKPQNLQPIKLLNPQPSIPQNLKPIKLLNSQPSKPQNLQPIKLLNTQPSILPKLQPIKCLNSQIKKPQNLQPVKLLNRQLAESQNLQPIKLLSSQPTKPQNLQPMTLLSLQPLEALNPQPTEPEEPPKVQIRTEIKTEPVDMDIENLIDIQNNPIIIKQEPIEACLDSSFEDYCPDDTSTVNEESDSRRTDNSHGDSCQIDNRQNDSTCVPDLGECGMPICISVKSEPQDYNDTLEIFENECDTEPNATDLLAVKTEPEDIQQELMDCSETNVTGVNVIKAEPVFDPTPADSTNVIIAKKVAQRKNIVETVKFKIATDQIKSIIVEDSDAGANYECASPSVNSRKTSAKAKKADEAKGHKIKSAKLGASEGSSVSDDIADTSAPVKSKKIKAKRNKTPKFDKYGNRIRNVYRCSKCGYTQKHRLFQLHKRSGCSLSPTGDTANTKFECTKCDRTFTSLNSYLTHFKKHGYRYLACPACNMKFEMIRDLIPHFQRHVKTSYVNCWMIKKSPKPTATKKQHKCQTCHEIVPPKEIFPHWEAHLQLRVAKSEPEELEISTEHDPAPNKKELSSSMLQNALRQLQLRMFDREKKCVVCGREFNRRHDIKRHLIEHLLLDALTKKDRLTKPMLRCQICSESFARTEVYKFHMREHGGLPVYRCELCNKTFSDSSNFAKHKKIHNMRVLICDVCEKKFHTKSSLEKHIIMHMTTEPVKCNICSKKFFANSAYKKHFRAVHMKKRESTCVICDMQFHSLREKWDHDWIVHKERKNKADCPICHKGYRKFRDVKQHAKVMHQVDLSYYNIKSKSARAGDPTRYCMIKQTLLIPAE